MRISAPADANSPRLVERVVDELRGRIVSGAYGGAGELPPQGELCAEFGVSRGVVREAMQRLQSQRLIDVSQGRKPRVMPAGPEAIAESVHVQMQRTEATWRQLGEVRRTLEVEIAGRAAERIDSVKVRALEKTLAAMQATDDTAQQVAADMQFHRVLAEATGNPVYVFLLDALAALLRTSRERTIGVGGVEPAVRGHRKILAAVQRGEAAAARRAMAEHLDDALADLERSESRP
jgi:DNA-binding FadR family transcriptional regulator